MLTFFRKIRQVLLNSSQIRKPVSSGVERYIFYAIGEIALVVIGILIALQINNWNEWRKERNLEKIYLKGIQDDLKVDTAVLNQVIPGFEHRLSQYVYVESSYFLDSLVKEPLQDTLFDVFALFTTPRPFKPTIGTYQAMISDGKSNHIKNRTLFAEIQQINEIEYKTIEGIYDILRSRLEKVKWENRLILRNKPYRSPREIKDPVLLSELRLLNESISLYVQFINNVYEQVVNVIDMIEDELNEK